MARRTKGADGEVGFTNSLKETGSDHQFGDRLAVKPRTTGRRLPPISGGMASLTCGFLGRADRI